MAREYRHLQMYEKEFLELREQGLTQREIAARFGVSYEKMHDFFKRYNRKQRQLAAGIEIRPKGRPPKDGAKLPPSVQQLSKVSQLQYELVVKYRVIFRHRNELSIREMCRLFDVSWSGYYDFVKRMDTPDKDLPLADKIRECQMQTKQTYGYQRMTIWLDKQGIH